ncbi:transcription factor xanC [Aspergillus candidus]|uniref:BZIP domain-containing protein n=1 Tax=Aspergillus candidus TaxID=41067 RepID=A0A2I2FNS9_ASPCN|nr:hypothetical protein BDW47DRAFT_26392 [Aspergillus candidus]PLB42270.1 hypothetical protein BDW47DRAFT_26392 [Aspergillus candidus]
MRAHAPKEERTSAEPATQKQEDPIERRRLQNRLSQRNHRRKIRDRIAKLQERVIATELRAAASLNGWNNPNPSAPPMGHALSPYEVDGGITSLSPETATSLSPSYLLSSAACSSCGPNVGSMPVLSSQSSSSSLFDFTGSEIDSSASSSMGSSFFSPRFSPMTPDLSVSMPASYPPADLSSPMYPEPWASQASYPPSNMYYVETTLPQIIQALGPGASRTKAIILLPQSNGHHPPAGMGPPPPPTGPSPSSAITATGASAIDPVIASLNPISSHPLACQCGSGSMPGSPGSVGGMDWMGAGTSPMCPVHGGQGGGGMESHQLTML